MNKENKEEIQLLSAEEAYSIAQVKREKVDELELINIMDHINDAANAGETEVVLRRQFSQYLSQKSINQLKKLGYKITEYTDNFYSNTRIEWNNPKTRDKKEKHGWKRELENFIRNSISC